MLETSTPSSSLINLLYGEDDDEKVRPPLTIQPPSSPRPTHRAVKSKRASSIVRSPYLAAVAPPRQSVVPHHSPSTKRSSPVKATQVYKNGLFVPIKRKSASNKATDVDSTVDYAGKTALDLRDELTAMKKNLSATEEQRDIFRGEVIKS
ncbi:PREDICTED: uncharacterized protein LOC109586926 [Amphimedon queenslandica]|uniref:Uncharacterized protein n=1 Tax=Amphimedon queenslandica TaxID=400682 RepID=A0A1X7TN93_AMPQE|nr:PREDICTED: uncharacterized protein LOC109586926 [Amphimedon queenslandica]|eukprot:XP_019858702.1 PREDICTED: uncharacterized protein LOC109586926 [Amphimedon queenslandica]